MHLMLVSFVNIVVVFFYVYTIIGVWLVAENKVREWAGTYSVIYVISGSILGESRRDQHGNYDW